MYISISFATPTIFSSFPKEAKIPKVKTPTPKTPNTIIDGEHDVNSIFSL